MRDLIRSPLQFVRPMTEQEWQAMMLRAAKRELRRKLRKRAQPKATPITKRRLELLRVAQAADTSGAC
jgi:transcriptional accessory protein Tex/SPT6